MLREDPEKVLPLLIATADKSKSFVSSLKKLRAPTFLTDG